MNKFLALVIPTLSSVLRDGSSFQYSSFSTRRRTSWTALASSLGQGPPLPPPDGRDNKKGEWDDFLNPDQEESENMRRAREYMSENSLPISFGASEGALRDSVNATKEEKESETSSLSLPLFPGGPTEEQLSRNPYMAVVSQLTPSELISKFTSTAHPRVQNAVRSTILGLIGGLPKLAFDTTTISTGQRLASLMFQLQMTGYMFKNAEYRLSVQQSLGTEAETGDRLLLTGSEDDEEDDEKPDPLQGKVKGKIRVKYGGSTPPGSPGVRADSNEMPAGAEMEVDAAAYLSELRSEVSKLKEALVVSRKAKEDSLRKDLLLYIRTLPPQELRALTNTISQDVLMAMKGLVNAVISGIGEGDIGPDTVTELSGEAMAQLCMWQLVIGYNLRTLEVREEMKRSLAGSLPNYDNEEGGVDLSQPGALE